MIYSPLPILLSFWKQNLGIAITAAYTLVIFVQSQVLFLKLQHDTLGAIAETWNCLCNIFNSCIGSHLGWNLN